MESLPGSALAAFSRRVGEQELAELQNLMLNGRAVLLELQTNMGLVYALYEKDGNSLLIREVSGKFLPFLEYIAQAAYGFAANIKADKIVWYSDRPFLKKVAARFGGTVLEKDGKFKAEVQHGW